MSYVFRPKDLLVKNLYIIFFLLLANVFGIAVTHYFDHTLYGLISLFNFDTERNIPTLYSSIALLVASGLLLFIAATRKKLKLFYLSWAGLSLIFFFLAIDEISSIHELLIDPARETFGATGLLYYAWVIPYGVGLLFFVFLYSRFLFRLPKEIMILFIVSGSIFVLGAIGFELIGGKTAEHGVSMDNSMLVSVLYTCEETLEMLGIALFIYTLLSYIVNHLDNVTVKIVNNQSA